MGAGHLQLEAAGQRAEAREEAGRSQQEACPQPQVAAEAEAGRLQLEAAGQQAGDQEEAGHC